MHTAFLPIWFHSEDEVPMLSDEHPSPNVTGIPGFATWRVVYLFVLGVFVIWVGVLTLLPRLFP